MSSTASAAWTAGSAKASSCVRIGATQTPRGTRKSIHSCVVRVRITGSTMRAISSRAGKLCATVAYGVERRAGPARPGAP